MKCMPSTISGRQTSSVLVPPNPDLDVVTTDEAHEEFLAATLASRRARGTLYERQAKSRRHGQDVRSRRRTALVLIGNAGTDGRGRGRTRTDRVRARLVPPCVPRPCPAPRAMMLPGGHPLPVDVRGTLKEVIGRLLRGEQRTRADQVGQLRAAQLSVRG